MDLQPKKCADLRIPTDEGVSAGWDFFLVGAGLPEMNKTQAKINTLYIGSCCPFRIDVCSCKNIDRSQYEC